jgi:GH15 family glucan-1,4-alpha-glucosidase
VGRNGSIDFMAFPTFDSPTVFAALLDMDRGGRFCIAPTLDQLRERQLYLPDTNVLLTRFMAGEGMAEISDFMPVEEVGHAHNLVRQVKTIRGEVTFRVHCEPRFDYARARHSVTANEREVIFESEASGLALRLRTPVALKVEDGAAVGEFTLRAGEVACFVLEEAKPGQESPTAAEDYVAQALEQTILFWRRWQDRSTYRGRWREAAPPWSSS